MSQSSAIKPSAISRNFSQKASNACKVYGDQSPANAYWSWFNETILIIQAQRTNLKGKRKDRPTIMQVRSRECQLFATMLIVDQSPAGEKLSLNICCKLYQLTTLWIIIITDSFCVSVSKLFYITFACIMYSSL